MGKPQGLLAMRRKSRPAMLLVGICAAAAVVLPAAPAQAYHNFCARHGDDVGCLKEGHRALDSCDREADGHRVRAWYRSQSNGEFPGAWDENGADAGCDRVWTVYYGTHVNVCEEVVGCAGWTNT